MRALVVYESMFGNTREVALAIADGIRKTMDVDALEVARAPSVLDASIALVVVGGPTHAHGLTTSKTRADAARRAGDHSVVSHGEGIREWLSFVEPGPSTAAAAFDTRIKGPAILWGSAARAADGALRRLGVHVVARPESFLVAGPSGALFDRLVEGELDRARSWGERVASAVAVPALTS